MRSSVVKRLSAVAALIVSNGIAFGQPQCLTLDACIETVKQHARGHGDVYAISMLRDDEALVDHVLTFDGAVARLVPLLRDPDDGIANFAGLILRDARSIDAKYLPDIEAGLDRGLGWLSPALCAMPGDAPAREAVRRFLVSKDAPSNQEAFAVERCGARAAPFIVAAARCAAPCPPGAHENLGYVLGETAPKIAAAVGPGLLQVARDPRTSDETARGVLSMIAVLGESAADLQGGLLDLRRQRPALAASVDAALVGVHADSAGTLIARRLAAAGRGTDVEVILRDVAALGLRGRDAGPEVLKLLRSDDWQIRVAAARALGFIQYRPAVAALIDALNDAADVRLNWVAAAALGQMKDPASADALQHVSVSHWYPPVRRAAQVALDQLRGSSPPPKRAPGDFPMEFFSYWNLGSDQRTCRVMSIPSAPEKSSRPLRATRDDVMEAAYPSTLPRDKDLKDAAKPQEIPAMALRVPGGWLTGTDYGEWGGKLMFVSGAHASRQLLDENVHDIWRLGDRIVALTGLAHLSGNRGLIYEVRKSENGDWLARPWRILPGSPERSRLVQTGELAIDVTRGGTILVAKDGSMRMAPCREFEKPD